MMGRLDLQVAPFNSIEFWLQGAPAIRRRHSIINVSLINQHGDTSVYRYLFNSEGMFEAVDGLPTYIPLSTYADTMRIIDLKEFLQLAHYNLPILKSVIA